MKLIEKYSTDNRTFKFAPDNRFIMVYIEGRLNGFIWNNNKKIIIDGDSVVSNEFFK